MTEDLIQAKSDLLQIVEKYKQHQDLTPDKPPAIGGYWSPAYGNLTLVENAIGYEHSFARKIVIGVQIGSKFAGYDREIVSALKAEIKTVIKSLTEKHGGFIFDQYGTAYSQLGWSK
jgi:hypothetical protein